MGASLTIVRCVVIGQAPDLTYNFVPRRGQVNLEGLVTLQPKEMLFDLQTGPAGEKQPWWRPELCRCAQSIAVDIQRGIEATDDPIHLGPIRPLEGAKVISAKSWNPEEGVTDQFDPERD